MAESGNAGLARVAFVFGDAEAATHVREALVGQVDVAYAAPATGFVVQQAAEAGAIATLVNLDGGDWLDPLEAALAAAGIRVVYNDPDISAHLEGWERARWLRHLVAKLRGAADVDPPRPLAPDVATPAVAVRKAEQPLSPEEIASLTADFAAQRAPGDAAASDEHALTGLDIDTEALSAMIDARLAEPEAPGLAREVDFASADAVAPPSSAAAAVSLPLAAAQVEHDAVPETAPDLPALGDWKLLDAEAPVAPAKSPKRVAPTVALPDSLADLSLVPMESLAAVQRSSEPVELWMDDAKTETKPRPEAGGGKA